MPRVFTIPASAPFMPTLIDALIGGRLVPGFPGTSGPLALAGATLYLPTRRACRLARDMFLGATGRHAAILPRIVALGDIDEDDIAFAQANTGALSAEALDLPPAIDALHRRVLLTQLVLRWVAEITPEDGEAPLVAAHPASALALADDLAHLIDDMVTRGIAWERLDTLVPDAFDRYWQLTLAFLKIAREAWPAILAERGLIEPAARRDALIAAEAARLAAQPDAPVIVAGSTGSMPASAALIATIAALPHGAVVLPGLDTDLDATSWQLIRAATGPAIAHPQFALAGLIERMGLTREDVAPLAAPAPHRREYLLSEALRPAAATDRWLGLGTAEAAARLDAALASVVVVEAANAEDEALSIAVALREAVETPGKTAALVTPDRRLARRVLAALARWEVGVDDSGGDPLPDTPAGSFARLAAEAALGGLPPITLLALLKHPLLRLGATEGAHARAIAALEQAVLRGPRPRPGSYGLARALASFRAELGKLRRGEPSDLHPSDPRTLLSESDLAEAAILIDRIAHAVAPLESLPKDALHPFIVIAARHAEVVATLSADPSGEAVAFAGHDGTSLDDVFDDLARAGGDAGFGVARSDYSELFRITIADRVVRRPEISGVRVHLYGPLESRLQSFDRIVLGGLVEGVWPPESRSDPWLSRPMRHALGLDPPERRISLSAHDFAQALGAPEVVLTYATKLAGTPTVTSRFVQRLAAVAGEARWQHARESGARYLGWARALDHRARRDAPRRPEPRPPRAARPTALSVTEIEHWLRDPYTIYARHILGLRELDAVDLAPGAADRGVVIHGALGEFTRTFAHELPDDPAAALIAIGERHFAVLEDYPEARAFWWPRFRRIAHWLAAWERERRGSIVALLAEASGHTDIPLGDRVFTLRGRADRIEAHVGGRYAILDYKTGAAPSAKQVQIGISPQLTLEAAILRRGGFPDVAAGSSVAELTYVSLKGGEPAGSAEPLEFKKGGNADDHAEHALARLQTVVERFEDEQQPYLPLVLPMWRNRYGTYDHLARVKEWSVGGDDEDEAGAGGEG